MKRLLKYLTALVFVFTLGILVSKKGNAQGPPPPPPPPSLSIPIDGGISLLVAAGIAYGGKKIFDAKKNKK